MTPEATRRKTGYGWKLGTFRLPTGTYTFTVARVDLDEVNARYDLDLQVTEGEYAGHRVRAFVPKDEWKYATVFTALLEGDYGLIVPATVTVVR